MSKSMSNVEKRASLLIKYRKLNVKKKEKEEDKTTYFLSRGDSNFIFLCIVDQRGIGIAYVRELRDLVEETGSDKGVIITDVKYTWSARFNARAWQSMAQSACAQGVPSSRFQARDYNRFSLSVNP